jgi:hypothetical protein
MKFEIQGRVVGHSLYHPNPKDEPDLELVKITMTLSPATSKEAKHTKAVLIVEQESSFKDLVLGRIVSLTVKDSQQDLFLPKPSPDAPKGAKPPKPAKDELKLH